ncbi:hypothetical protein B0H11DRAFT_2430502 [Mycena galericulata]|nr:hypothetical protein B0H11DRAFT_2430502 [Mycena galericulata]
MSRRIIKADTSVAQSAAPLDASPQDRCLRNPDLLEQILRYCGAVPHEGDRPAYLYKSMARKCLYTLLLTCRAFYDCGVKVLWASLDNFLPLLRLLPSFALLAGRGGKHVYTLPGSIGEAEWAVFDRYAGYVKEIVYAAPRNVVDPFVYVRLAMRRMTLLPNLLRLECYVVDAPSADILLAISPSIMSVKIHSPRLSHLSIGNCRGSVLSICKSFGALRSLDLQRLEGSLSTTELVEIGSIPLQSFGTDMDGWDNLNFETISPRRIFVALTHLNVNATSALLDRNIPLLLPLLGGSGMFSIIIAANRRRNSGVDDAHTFTVISEQISSRWARSLKHLELREIPCTLDAFSSMQALMQLETLTLENVIKGPLSDPRVLAVVRALPALTALSIEGAEADLTFLACVAQNCFALRELHVGFHQPKLPDSLSATPALAHPLHTLKFITGGRKISVTPGLFARHLDRLFPRLARITGVGSGYRWEEIEIIVFVCQDVRRTALHQQ